MSIFSSGKAVFSSPEPKAHKVRVMYTNGSSSVVVHTFKLLWSQKANLDQILCVASLGWGKGCIRFWGRLDRNSGFHGKRKPPLTYNRENDNHLFSDVFDPILIILADNEDMIKISDEFKFRPDGITDYGVSCPWVFKKFPIDLLWENAVSMLTRSFLMESSSKLLVTRTGIKARKSLISGVTCPWMTKILHIQTWLSLMPVGQSWSNFICSITGGGERLHNVWGRLDQNWCPWQQKAPIHL